MLLSRSLLLCAVACSLLSAQAGPPDRTVSANTLTSTHDPALRITLPKAVQYVGADHFVLYGIADCELHAFVEADKNRKVTRLYWIQFEGYLPSKPDLHHTYDSPRHATVGGWDFFVDTWVRGRHEPVRPGSDRESVETILKAKGYKMPEDMMYVRLVHLLDAEKRKELMIIYGEDLSSTGMTVASLKEGGEHYNQWHSLEDGMIERAEQEIEVQPLAK